MSEKVRDRKNRWRAITVAFRASPEENELLNRKVYICGITKQRYIIDRLLEDKVRVVVNRKVLNRLSERPRKACMCHRFFVTAAPPSKISARYTALQ